MNCRWITLTLALALLLSIWGCARPPHAPSDPAAGVAPPEPLTSSVDAPMFTGDLAMGHVEHLAGRIGPRPTGSVELDEAVEYVIQALGTAGYAAEKMEYELPGGGTAHNISATRAGRSDEQVVLAAHLETVPGSPGANDDASGVGAMLELAELLKDEQPLRSVRFLFVTAEEKLPDFDDHGYSSLAFVEGLEPEELAQIAAVVWLDKIGAGPELKVMHISDSRSALAEEIAAVAREQGLEHRLVSARRWSEAMAFEDRDIPTAWVEYGPAPELHRPTDDIKNVHQDKLAAVGRLVHEWLMRGPAQ